MSIAPDSSQIAQSQDTYADWISWFCSLKGNELFVPVAPSFIDDPFNLTGLDSTFKYYTYALDMILDHQSDDPIPRELLETVEEEAEQLYGLIHARYILTQPGLEAMLLKYQRSELGRCPRVLCNGQPTLPIGLTTLMNAESVRLFCPRCDEVYSSKYMRHSHIDGAFFGTTFPHLFFLTFPELKPNISPPQPLFHYTPRVFGFKLHPTAFQVSLKYKMQDEYEREQLRSGQQQQQQRPSQTHDAQIQ